MASTGLQFGGGASTGCPVTPILDSGQDMQIRDDPKKGLHDVRSFVGACKFYWRHIHNFTYSSAPVTDLIKKTTPYIEVDRQRGGAFPGVEEENCLLQVPGSTPPQGRDSPDH